MRFLELHLEAFGPFSGERLDFSATPSAVHVIYGPNEAGKSTALRAIRHLLFGMPVRTRDAWHHPNPKLRIGGRLETGQGTQLTLVRRKGKQRTLTDGEGNPVPPEQLQACLGGINEELFLTMFGLDYARLRAGGEALLAGRGAVGQSLFQAATGGRAIHAVLQELEAEADTLFSARGRTKALNEAIRAYRDSEDRRRAAGVSATAWSQQQAAVDASRQERQALDQKRRTLLEEQSALQRRLRLLPLIAQRHDCLSRRAHLEQQGDGDRPEPFATTPEAEMEQLAERWTQYRLGRRELEQHEAEIRAGHAEIDALFRKLGWSAENGFTEPHVSPDLQARVRMLAGRYARIQTEVDHRSSDLQQRQRRRIQLRSKIDQAGPPPEIQPLRKAVEAARAAGDLDARLDRAEQLATDAEHRAKHAAAQLGPWRGTESELANAPTPSIETVERYRREHDDLDRNLTERGRRERQLETERAETDQRLASLTAEGELPTEAELEHARRTRDQQWSALKQQWSQGTAPQTPHDLETFEEAIRRADRTADGLRSAADRISRVAQLEAQRQALGAECTRVQSELTELRDARAAAEAQWKGCWDRVPVTVAGPSEMLAWLRRFAEARRLRLEADRARQAHQEARDRARRAFERLQQALPSSLRPSPEAEKTVAPLVAEAERVLQERREALETRRRHEEMLAALEAEIREIEEPLAGSQQDLEQWRSEWRTCLARIGLSEDAGVEEANAWMDAFAQVHQRRERIRQLERSVERTHSEARALAVEVDAWADDHGIRLPEGDLDRRADELLATYRRARERLAETRTLDHRIAELEAQLLGEGEGRSLATLLEDASGAGADPTRARLNELDEQLEDVNESFALANREYGSRVAGLENQQERTAAIEAAAESEGHLARIRVYTERYVRLKLGAAVLRQEVERYRAANQGPILSRARELFERLTHGRYCELRADLEGENAVLQCVRAEGDEVGVEGLSDGTLDQLYLALRLASLEHHLRYNEPVPLIVDDLLVHFDDERAKTALQILAELSGQTQVLFFTHHARLRELATEVVSPDHLKIHTLASSLQPDPREAPAVPSPDSRRPVLA